MQANLLDLAALVRAIGRASVFYATGAFAFDEYGADISLTHLGDTDGDIEIEPNDEYSVLTAEVSGPMALEKYYSGESPQITIPLFVADPDVRAIASPIGSASGGFFRRRRVTEYTLALIPEEVFLETNAETTLGYTQAGGWTVGGDAATAAQLSLLDLALWFWRGHFGRSVPKYSHADGGKAVQPIVFFSMGNLEMPDGEALYTSGRPDQRPTPIYLSTT